MVKKRPCRMCLKWFLPSVFCGKRQQVCNSPECQKKRHRRSSAEWRERNPGWDRAGRLRTRIRAEDSEEVREKVRMNPLAGLQWDMVRDAVGLEVAVIVEEACEQVTLFSRRLGTERSSPERGG